ncbi:MAG: DUF4169 family protein [Marinosulfonomonas sp.]
MTQPINLNKARKKRAIDQRKAKAAENSVKFGLSGTDKKTISDRSEKAARILDGHRKERLE